MTDRSLDDDVRRSAGRRRPPDTGEPSPFARATAHLRAARANGDRRGDGDALTSVFADLVDPDDLDRHERPHRRPADRYDDGWADDRWPDDRGDDRWPEDGWPDDRHGDDEPAGDRATKVRRRALLGLAGTGLGGAVLYTAANGLPGTRGGFPGLIDVPPPPPSEPREVGFRASEAGGFANRDESYARSVGQPTPAPEPPPAAEPPSTLFGTPSEAAANTQPAAPTLLTTDDTVKHLLRRATFGPTPELFLEVHDMGIDAWLEQQLDPASIPDGEADAVWAQFPRAAMGPQQIQAASERYSWDPMFDYGKATLARQIWSRRQLFEVMVDFWANHLNVATPGDGGWDVAAAYHNDVIRRHALGSFPEMLLAAIRHPALLRFLTNDDSSKESVNENLGRELLELHTVGVQSGYTEDDVRNSAYILTGRTVAGEMDEGGRPEGTFYYDPERHWTGAVQVLDFRHENASAEGGMEVGDAYARYLAGHPATARTIARKLAVRFVSDDPPDVLVERLATAYTDGGGQIVPILQTLFRSGEFWAAVGQKTRRPLENVVATARTLGIRPGGNTPEVVGSIYWSLQNSGHRPLAWPAPNGYPDVQPAWRSANGLLEVWNSHRGLVQGWTEGATYTPADQLIGDRPRGTVGEYVDSLCERLCLQRFQPEHRNALIAFLEAEEGTPSDQVDFENMADHLAPLVLDSPYFALR